MNKKSIYFKILPAILCTTFLYACNTNSTSGTNTQTSTTTQVNASNVVASNTSSSLSDVVTYEQDDFYTDWKNENPNYIKLSGSSATVEGSGAEVEDNKITITVAGTYVISGKLDNGQIIVNSQDKGTVRIILNGAEITCKDSAPIYVKSAGKAVVSLGEGTENTITDGTSYTLEDETTDEPNSALFSKDDLTINGTGKLTVNGNYNNGITSKDDLKITGGTIVIKSADDGIMGKDIVAVKDGNITINAGGDGLKSTNDTEEGKGIVAIEGGTFNITSEADGIQAKTSILVTAGDFTINSGGGSANAPVKAEEKMMGPWGGGNAAAQTTETEEESSSSKAIKSSTDITISGGTFKIDSADDAIHSNDTITIDGGDITITSGDDGIHSDTTLTINDGKVNITKSYEGIESAVINIAGGDIHVVASDDGINVAGGNDGSSVNGRPGQNSFSASGDYSLNINGGYLVVDAAGDGLDANGSIYMTDGKVIVNGPTSDGNGPLDYDGVFEMSGGFLVSAGSSGMAQAPSGSSTQYSIIMNYPQVQAAGTLVHLEDSEGNTIATFAPSKNYQAVVITSPEIKNGGTYKLYSGGTSTGTNTDGLYEDGEYKDGTEVVSFTTSSTVTWLNESGVTEAQSGHGMGGGGMQGGGTRPERPTGVEGEQPMPPTGEMPVQQ
jgi:hypothetical protein